MISENNAKIADTIAAVRRLISIGWSDYIRRSDIEAELGGLRATVTYLEDYERKDDLIRRLQRAIIITNEWFASHQYTGDGLNVLQVLREVSSPEEVEKAREMERNVLQSTKIEYERAVAQRDRLKSMIDQHDAQVLLERNSIEAGAATWPSAWD